MSEMDPFQSGEILPVRVERIDQAGVVVRLPDDSQGVIRRQELTWDRQIRRPELMVKTGDHVEALLLRLDQRSGLWELSLRQAKGNPWDRIAGRCQIHSVVAGRVVSVLDDRAYVQIVPGVDALLMGSAVPLKSGQTIKDALWVGDKVVGLVTYLDPAQKRMTLNVRDYLAQVKRIKAQIRDRAQAQKQVARELAAEVVDETEIEEPGAMDGVWMSLRDVQAIRRIMVIDDDPGFHGPFSEGLRRRGYEVEVVELGPEGYDKAVSDAGIDLLFLDVNLVEGNGLHVAREILEARPALPIVIITALDWFRQDLDLTGLDIVDVVLKPPDFNEIDILLKAIETGKWIRRKSLDHFGGQPAELVCQVIGSDLGQKNWKASVQKDLENLVRSTGATCALLFYMDPVTDMVGIEARAGSVDLKPNYDWNQARYSPIRDVIQRGEEIREVDARDSRVERRFRNLLDMLAFASCVGLPIAVPERSARYGLFLFHILPQYFTEAHFAQALLATRSLSLTVEREHLAQAMHTFQQFAVAGQLGSGLAHEMGNRLTGLEQCSQNLQLTVDGLCIGEKLTPGELADLRKDIGGLGQLNAELRELIHFYLGLIRSEEAEVLDVNQVLTELAERMRRTARDNRVDILLELDADLSSVQGARARLQQACLNVMLNAVQHIRLYSHQGGILVIGTRSGKSFDPRPVKITFSDDGPGIHRQMFERIFERGVSTRQDGPGLGLFISRSLVESIGGRVRVEDSTLFVGSSFLIELPAVSLGGVRP